jgi:hypothetical protein
MIDFIFDHRQGLPARMHQDYCATSPVSFSGRSPEVAIVCALEGRTAFCQADGYDAICKKVLKKLSSPHHQPQAPAAGPGPGGLTHEVSDRNAVQMRRRRKGTFNMQRDGRQ